MKIEDASGKSLPISEEPVVLTLDQRLIRAGKAAGFGFLMALAAVFVPVFHFILVPSFLVLSVFLGWCSFKQTGRIGLAGDCCPICDKPLREKEIFFSGTEIRLFCFECRTQLRIVP